MDACFYLFCKFNKKCKIRACNIKFEASISLLFNENRRQEIEAQIIDLFSGLGGIRIGFEQALVKRGLKGKCVFTSEIKPSAIKALNENFPGENIKATDITTIKKHDIPEFKVLLGGFPCQAFSSAGLQKGFADTRGTLFFDVQRVLSEHLKNVDGFILENVEGLVTHDRENKSDKTGRTINTIMHVLKKELGFNAEFIVLNAADFGVPQYRKRVYIVGCKKKFGKVNLNFKNMQEQPVGNFLETGLPALKSDFSKKLLKHFTVEELNGKALKDKRGGSSNIHSWEFDFKGKISDDEKDLLNALLLARRKRKWAEEIGITWMDGMPLTTEQIRTFFDRPNLQQMLNGLTDKKYLVYEHPKKQLVHKDSNGNRYTTRVPDTTKAKGYNIVTGKLSFEISSFLDKGKPAKTIVAMDMGNIGVIDNGGIRHLTLREGLRLFGYPDSYSLKSFENSQRNIRLGYDLIGNSVCVPVIEAIAERLLDRINPQKK